jgi:hypothetical protein
LKIYLTDYDYDYEHEHEHPPSLFELRRDRLSTSTNEDIKPRAPTLGRFFLGLLLALFLLYQELCPSLRDLLRLCRSPSRYTQRAVQIK